MRGTHYNAGNASDAKLEADILEWLARDPIYLGLCEVHDRRQVLAKVAKNTDRELIQFPTSTKGHCALLIREDANPRNARVHQVGERTYVGRDVAGARTNGMTAAKYIVAADLTLRNGRDVTAAEWHAVPSASHSERASRLLRSQASEAAAWLADQPLPTDLMADWNGRPQRPEFAQIVKLGTVLAPKGDHPIDWHLITQGTGKAIALHGSSDHPAVEADITWRRS